MIQFKRRSCCSERQWCKFHDEMTIGFIAVESARKRHPDDEEEDLNELGDEDLTKRHGSDSSMLARSLRRRSRVSRHGVSLVAKRSPRSSCRHRSRIMYRSVQTATPSFSMLPSQPGPDFMTIFRLYDTLLLRCSSLRLVVLLTVVEVAVFCNGASMDGKSGALA
jgi:hypothetical protein